jgi:Fur family ferric uptake transcriptional regulator
MTPLEIKQRKLRGGGNKITPQRIAILKAIDGMRSQFTPQELYRKLSERAPEIGLVTVYRTLKLLAESGLVCLMGYNGRSQIYARSSERHHHHLVCAGCDRVVDISSCGLDELEKKLARETGFAIAEHHLEFTGLCRDCQAVSAGEPL